MAIEATITGNMLMNPSQKIVNAREGTTTITTFLMMSDVYVGSGDDMRQDDTRSSPVAITIWNERIGHEVMRLYRAGMRLVVEGDVHLHHYEPKEAEYGAGKDDVWELRCAAHRVALLPNRVEAITMRAKRSVVQAPESAAA